MNASLAAACRKRFFDLADTFEYVVTDDPLHIGYLCGYRSILHDMAPYSQLLIAGRDGCTLVTGASDAGAALEVLDDPAGVYRFGVFHVYGNDTQPGYGAMPPSQPTYHDALKTALRQKLTRPDGILLDVRNPASRTLVDDTLPAGCRTSPADTAFRLARAVKLPGEIDLLRKASAVTDAAIAAAALNIRPGIRETELAAEIAQRIHAGGGIPRFIVVTSGERSSRVDAYATDRAVQDGDLVRIDVGGSFSGYNSDMARSFHCGPCPPLAAERYEALLRGEQAELDLIRPGVPAREIFDAAVAEVRRSGLPEYRRNHCGHGIGLSAHEFPYITPDNDTPLESGMVLCLETPYYETGWGGIMVEDTVVVTETGHERLTPSTRAFRYPTSRAARV